MTRPIDDRMNQEAARRLHEAAPDAAIILFGSHARGDDRAGSDLDFLVIEPEIDSRHEEMVRLRDALRPMRIPVDIMVISAEAYREWGDVPGTLYCDAKQDGKVLIAAG